MEFKNPLTNSSKLLATLSLLWASVILLLGAWWVYVMMNFQDFLTSMERSSMLKMLAWEGGSFLVLILLLSISILLLFIKDQKKTKSLQAFFASLTHELKTPLASIRLQGEVINEILESRNDPTLNKLLSRLIGDTAKLETQMDKLLQLSRIERGGELNLTSVSLIGLINKLSKTTLGDEKVNLSSTEDKVRILADEFALELIIKNLFENSVRHSQSKEIDIQINAVNSVVHLTYCDHGFFDGDLNKLGTLFYKHNSSKGSGIGLYLSKKLMLKMGGDFLINKDSNNSLMFTLIFKSGNDANA